VVANPNYGVVKGMGEILEKEKWFSQIKLISMFNQ